ncbi:NACHT domain-containing protein [Plectonema cf. radiosum LEGE 06105]|uniref:NACHT domain-containing protein n=1 Tax=Plectonema cf. radiosum LEGE 06105 TaxID=945769 RepID=A0A8J7F6R2_9CYAN|nr:NACHT domain-containing protein [Plectonema radiosum]MBE9215045.1 NACHT domain-containing protein [Plectonema cf. radiosum LEGE 06105]
MNDKPDSNPIQQTAASNLQAGGNIYLKIIQSATQGDVNQGISPDFSWKEICESMLKNVKALTSNLFTNRAGVSFELDDVYVPLGLVEKQIVSKQIKDVSPEEGSNIFREKITPIPHQKFFEEALKLGKTPRSQGRCIALTGEAGAGKTTLLQKIAQWVVDNNLGLPIWVHLGTVGTRTLSEYLIEIWLPTATANITPIIKEDFEKQFSEGTVWLLLDGLDEMTNPTEAQFISSLQTGWVASARIILSCRLNIWEIVQGRLSGFDVYRNLDFKPEQVQQFINNWFSKISKRETAEKLLLAIESPGKERIRDLIRNPLRCSLLCRSWQLGEENLPDTKAELYAQFIDAIYDEWKDWTPETFSTRLAAKRELNQALGSLAKRAIDEEKSRFVLNHDLVASELGEIDEPLLKLALKLNLLVLVGLDPKKPSKNIYAFYHPTFEEYFAALAIDDGHFFLNHKNQNYLPNYKEFGRLFSPQNLDYFAGQEIGTWTILSESDEQYHQLIQDNHKNYVYRIFEAQWKEVILLWLGREGNTKLIQQKENFIKSLLEFEDDCMGFYSFRAYFLAAEGIAEFKNCALSIEIVTQIVDWSLGYSEENPIAKAAMTVLPSTDDAIVYNYLNELDNSDENNPDDDPSIMRQNAITLAYAIMSGYNPDEPYEENSNSIHHPLKNENNYIKDTSEEEIDALIIRLRSTKKRISIINTALRLVDILPNHLLKKVVISLRECLRTDKFLDAPIYGNQVPAYENEFYRFKCSYLVLWHCAQNIPYAEFYDSWHN